MWSTDHPVVFTLGTGITAACIAYLVAVQQWTEPWRLAPPELKQDFDIAAYAGVPWSVQATLVALVYPIVLSFIALMLQRKAHSTVVLRVYVLDSAVVPAGATSIGLLIGMAIQYFATPYSTHSFLAKYMAPLLAMNGAWLLVNVLLTGFFLSRTIHFIQEEEQRHAFTRVAVDVVLRAELISAVKQHIFVNAAQSDWHFPESSANPGPHPQVHTFAFMEGHAEVKRDLKDSLELYDVHLLLLRLVAISWSRRARQRGPATNGRPPTLRFTPRIDGVKSGEVILCTVEDGPHLSRFERFLVRTAFVYRPSKPGTLFLSTRNMLEEIGGEIEAAAEQQRFGAAQERLRDLLRLHKALLLASTADSEGVVGNAATIGTSPYSWGDSSFDLEWIKPYRDVGRIAVSRLDEDSRLFNAIAAIPASIAAGLPSRPEKLLIDAQMVGTNLAYQLAGWWTRKADASLLPGATTFSGTLPAPLNKVYERAVVAFIGSWGHFEVNVPNYFEGGDAEAWEAFASRALIYAAHIENSAFMFLKAVSRGDEVGASWLLDNLLKWWGNRKYELKCAEFDEWIHCARPATITLAHKDWIAAREFLSDGAESITIDFAKKALSLALRNYWESMRLYVVLLLIQNAGSDPAADSRELRHAAALIRGTAQHGGGEVDVRPLDSMDKVLKGILGHVFSIESASSRIDGFGERLRWENEVAEVSGWVYSWSGTPMDLGSMKRAQAVLLASLATARRDNLTDSQQLIEQWWNDIDKLEAVERYCGELRREVRSSAFDDARETVSSLKSILGNTRRVRFGQLAVALSLRKLARVASRERRLALRAFSIDQAKIRQLGLSIAIHAFDAAKLPPPIESLQFEHVSPSLHRNVFFTDERKRYLEHVEASSDSSLAQYMGDAIRHQLVASSFIKLVRDNALTPINNAALRQQFNASHADMQAYLAAVVSRCLAYQSRGERPVVLVGHSAARTLLSAYRWGPEDWKCPLPTGIVISAATEGDGERAVALINGVPVFDFDTPNGDCYVLPVTMVQNLSIAGVDATSALSISWSEEGDERLRFSLSWDSAFLSTAA